MDRILANFLSQSWFSSHASSVFHLPSYYGSYGNQKLVITLPIKIMINFQSKHVRISVRMYKLSLENKNERNAI